MVLEPSYSDIKKQSSSCSGHEIYRKLKELDRLTAEANEKRPQAREGIRAANENSLAVRVARRPAWTIKCLEMLQASKFSDRDIEDSSTASNKKLRHWKKLGDGGRGDRQKAIQ